MDFIMTHALPFVLQALHQAPHLVDAVEAIWRALTAGAPNHQHANIIVTVALTHARQVNELAKPPAA